MGKGWVIYREPYPAPKKIIPLYLWRKWAKNSEAIHTEDASTSQREWQEKLEAVAGAARAARDRRRYVRPD